MKDGCERWRPTRPVTAAGGDPIGATPRGGTGGGSDHPPGAREGNLDTFLTGLATAWQHGEVRATHRRTPRPARDWRTRTDPFEGVWPCVRAWLEAEPDRIGRELFVRLQSELPGVFPDGQLRTFQRRSESGATPPRGNSSSRPRPRTPRERARADTTRPVMHRVRHPPSAAPVRCGGQCAGLTVGASAPIGATALTFQNAVYDGVGHG